MTNLPLSRALAVGSIVGVLLLVGWSSLGSGGSSDSPMATGSRLVAEGTGPPRRQSGTDGAAGADSGLQIDSGSRRIVVDVSGEVKRPGVYGFTHGERVIEAIRRAGGVTGNAWPAGINRAAVLADGQQVVVPSRSASGAGGVVGAGAATAVAPGSDAGPISLGTATQAQLEEIEGIGPVTAQSILEFRDAQGGISSIDELDQVTGIGPVTMEALKSRLQP